MLETSTIQCNIAAKSGQVHGRSTYEDPSELEIEFKLEALWLLSPERAEKLGTTSCERWILGDTRFLLYPLSAAIKYFMFRSFNFLDGVFIHYKQFAGELAVSRI